MDKRTRNDCKARIGKKNYTSVKGMWRVPFESLHQETCHVRGIKYSGRKSELQNRLVLHWQVRFPSIQR